MLLRFVWWVTSCDAPVFPRIARAFSIMSGVPCARTMYFPALTSTSYFKALSFGTPALVKPPRGRQRRHPTSRLRAHRRTTRRTVP